LISSEQRALQDSCVDFTGGDAPAGLIAADATSLFILQVFERVA